MNDLSKPTHHPSKAKNSAPRRGGFYNRQLQKGELKDLESGRPSGLQDEIVMLKVVIRRVMQLAEGAEDLKEATGALNSLSAAAARLARLMEAQKRMSGGTSQVDAALLQALAEVKTELREKP